MNEVIFKSFNLNIDDYMLEEIIHASGVGLLYKFPELKVLSSTSDTSLNDLANYKEQNVVVIDNEVLNMDDLKGAYLSNKTVKVYYYGLIKDLKVAIKNLIWSHMVSGNKELPLELVKVLEKNYPEYMFHGYAYRVVESKLDLDHSLLTRGTSWSLNEQGVENFLFSSINDDTDFPVGTKFYFIEANISGISLIRLVKEEFSELVENFDSAQFLSEDEVIATEIHDVIKVTEKSPEDL